MQPTDPCAKFKDSLGNFDFVAYAEDVLADLACGAIELKTVKSTLATIVVQHLQLAASHLRAAVAVHQSAKDVTNKPE